MASRKKEDEKNEKIIRGLLKLPANRRCINCNNLGPQYVCTNFWTFICTNCSGLHREFCHRVKSISMAKFTAQEVSALQEGGNERAREIYFKDWDSQRNSLPDSSNIDRLRDFIKHVYVDRRFSGEKNTDKPLRGKADMSDSSDSGRGDSYRGSPRSPAYDDRFNERLGVGGRNGDRNFRNVYGERSPGYDQGDNKRSPRRFEVVDDRVRDDRSGNGNQFHRFEDRRLPEVLTKPDESSPSSQKDMASPPLVRPVRDILGSDAPQLHVGDTSKSNNSSIPDNSSQTQRASSASSVGSGDGNTLQSKKVDFGSLIDFSEDPEPPAIASPQQSVRQQNISPPSNGGDWASFDVAAHQTASQAAASSGVVNSGLTQLSALLIPSVDASPKAKDGGEWPKAQQHQASLFPADLSSSTNPPLNAPVTGSRQWGLSGVPGIQGPLPNSAGNLPQVPNKPPPEPTPPGSTPPHVEVKPTGRKELPVDLFAALYPPAHVSMPGWQRGPHPGMGYGMQYPVGMHQSVPTFPHPSRSSNPFDFGSEPALTHAPTFPSLGSLQGALPNVPGPSPLLRSTSFGNPSPQWGLGHQSSFPPALSQGQYLMQQVPGNMQQLPHSNMVMMGHQGTGGPGSPGAMYGNMGMDNTHSTGRYSLPNTPNSNGSGGGNPFG